MKIISESHVFIEADVLNPEINEGIIPEIELNEGIYISKAIVKVKNNNKCIISVLNTRVTDQYLDNISIKLG